MLQILCNPRCSTGNHSTQLLLKPQLCPQLSAAPPCSWTPPRAPACGSQARAPVLTRAIPEAACLPTSALSLRSMPRDPQSSCPLFLLLLTQHGVGFGCEAIPPTSPRGHPLGRRDTSVGGERRAGFRPRLLQRRPLWSVPDSIWLFLCGGPFQVHVRTHLCPSPPGKLLLTT